MRILVVIDVHVPYVQNTDSKVIESVANAVQHARDNGDFVCIVEHRSSRPVQPTHDAVVNSIAEYSLWERLSKDVWSASAVVHEMLDRRQITPTGFVVCGAVSHECVVGTLRELRRLHPEISLTLVTSACLSDGETPYDWAEVETSLNLNLVERLSAA